MWNEMQRMERRYSVPSIANEPAAVRVDLASEDLHAWSIYRQNLNSDFADSALGAGEKSPLPYGNFQLRESTVRSILRHPRYGPRSELGGNMYTYLKFGLPRVFPPGSRNAASGPRDGSSGYDSSDDGSPRVPARAGYLRSRSEQALNLAHHYATQQRRISSNQPPGRSNSEANLLAMSTVGLTPSQRASSQQYLASTNGNYDLRVPPAPKVNTGTARRRSSGLMMLPHLQLRGVHLERKRQRVLENVNLEARGGDMLGIMATSEVEGTALLEVLAGRVRASRGEVWLNGHLLGPTSLKRHVAVVSADSDSFDPDMSTRQTLRFHAWLAVGGGSSKARRAEVEALLSELGLSQVRDTRVASLTQSERVRLHVACALLTGCDILALDGPAKQMDIFDTFFLLEFLRQWSTAAPRIVILALHPPTFEIFCMLSRAALLASGRLMYCGRRKDMLPYFARIEYPCPAFKNPSDYYLDLVTLDDLSAEAMLESSQRIQQLAEVFARRQQPLSDPGAPVELPPRASRAGLLRQATAIILRAAMLHCPLGLVRFSRALLVSALLSVALGAVFWDLRTSPAPQHSLNDWLGYHVAMMGVATVPLALWAAEPATREKRAVNRDVKDGLYSRGVFYLCKLILDLPVLICIAIAFFAPAYAMSGGLSKVDSGVGFVQYIGLMALYLLSSHALLLFFLAWLNSRLWSTVLGTCLQWLLVLMAGFPLHEADLSPAVAWLRWVSPARWLLAPIVAPELQAVQSVTCKAVQVQRQDIIVQLPCAVTRGEDALRPYALTSQHPWTENAPIPALAVAVCAIAWALFAYIGWLIRRPSGSPKKVY